MTRIAPLAGQLPGAHRVFAMVVSVLAEQVSFTPGGTGGRGLPF